MPILPIPAEAIEYPDDDKKESQIRYAGAFLAVNASIAKQIEEMSSTVSLDEVVNFAKAMYVQGLAMGLHVADTDGFKESNL